MVQLKTINGKLLLNCYCLKSTRETFKNSTKLVNNWWTKRGVVKQREMFRDCSNVEKKKTLDLRTGLI